MSTCYRSNESKNVPKTYVKIESLVLNVRHLVEDTVENYVVCDTKHMISTMDHVRNALREKMHCISMDDAIYLIMENAGGHGKNYATKKCTIDLKTKYNLKIIHQVPRSPCCNALNLRVWCSLHASVEKFHFMRRCNTISLV